MAEAWRFYWSKLPPHSREKIDWIYKRIHRTSQLDHILRQSTPPRLNSLRFPLSLPSLILHWYIFLRSCDGNCVLRVLLYAITQTAQNIHLTLIAINSMIRQRTSYAWKLIKLQLDQDFLQQRNKVHLGTQLRGPRW
jgi:hypothetical protein